ncbi:MAG: T9SS type A sorting domain-containing protein [Candidatus Kapaibacterium sp.]
MRRVIFASACCLLLAVLARNAGAQSMPASTSANFRWNEYTTVERFTDESGFQTILDDPNTLPVTGSGGLNYNSSTITLPLSVFQTLDISVMGEEFFNDANVQVGVAGFFKFFHSIPNSSGPTPAPAITPPSSTSYFLAPNFGDLNHLIMPFWGNLNSAGSGEGIWYNYSSSGTPTLKIEWHVHAPGTQTFKFQAWVILKVVNNSTMHYYATIEFHYDKTEMAGTIWSAPTNGYTYQSGAAVGLKNWGQYDDRLHFIGPYWSNSSGGEDDRNSMMIPPVQNGTDPAYTRVPMHYINSEWVPEWYACTPLQESTSGSASTIFHYKLPPEGYRVKPVDNEILTSNAGAKRRMGDSVKPIFDRGIAAIMTATFKNRGTDSEFNVPVRVDVFRNLALIKTSTDTITALAPGDSIVIAFPDSINTAADSLLPGSYTLRAYHSLSNDQNRLNDTACSDFTIRETADMAPMEILSPSLTVSPSFTHLPIGVPVPIRVRFGNCGTSPATNVRVGYHIRNGSGEVIATVTDSIQGTIVAGDTTTRQLPSWTPVKGGYYYIDVFTALPGDRIRRNDTILSMPNSNFVWWGTSEEHRQAQHIPFIVQVTRDIAVSDPAYSPHIPVTGTTVNGSFQPAILIRNLGSSNATGIPMNLVIRNNGNVSVNMQSAATASLASNGVTEALFNPVTLAPGNYCATVTAIMLGDENPANDSRTWCFTVGGSVGAPEIESDAARLTVYPNPATSEAWIDYRLSRTGTIQCGLFDIYGNQLNTWTEGYSGGDAKMRVDLANVPSGLYAVRMETADGARRVGWIVVRK